MCVDDAGMRSGLAGDLQEIVIVCDDYSILEGSERKVFYGFQFKAGLSDFRKWRISNDKAMLATRKFELESVFLIACANQVCITGCGNINTPKSQSMSHGAADIFVKMKANLHQRLSR
jgi:hypothetical protein